EAEELARRVLDALDYVGVLAAELFDVDGPLLAHEMAPRVHNSRHWTIEGADTRQFEDHLRAVVGWPLGAAAAPGPCAMINLPGSAPPTERLLALPGVHVHLYGKQPRAGRKIGHVTVTAADDAELAARIARVEAEVRG